uniref:Solute carrier family 22 member 13 n=1 Tax=Naja naja TaxID=35670 RepID=A0A8C6XMD6_NAJNA
MLTIASPFSGFHMFSQLFMVIPVPHHCNTNWLDTLHLNLTEEEKLNLTIPRNPDGTLEQCLMYTPMETNLETILQTGLNSAEKCRDGWVYPSKPKPSLITQFSLVCDQKDLIDISQSIFMSGLLVGAMCDWTHKEFVLVQMLSVYIKEKIHSSRVKNHPVQHLMIVIRYNEQSNHWVGVAYRPHTIITAHVTFALGQMLLAGLAYGLRDWRHLQIAGSAPVFIFFFYIWVLPESARWLVMKGKIEEAKKVLKKAASVNKQTIPPRLLEEVKFLFPASVKLLLFVNSLAYYGLSLNVGNLTNIYLPGLRNPARILSVFLMQRLGKEMFCCSLLFLIFCLFISIFLSPDLPVVITMLAVLGKLTMAGSFSTSYVYSAELFPTIIRQTGLGVCQMTARVAGIISPLVGLLGKYHTFLPVAIFGSAAVIGGIFSLLLPETLGKDLPDCVDDLSHKPRQDLWENLLQWWDSKSFTGSRVW